MPAGLKRRLYRASRNARHPGRLLEARSIRNEVARLLGGARVLAGYEREVSRSGLPEHLLDKGREHQAAVVQRGDGHSLGAIGYTEGTYLYAVMRKLRPEISVETGVANGFSTAFALLALQENGAGHLHSVDLPREAGRDYEPGTFYEGEGRAGIPPGSEPGWLIPPELKEHWTLILGRSQEALPPLLERLGPIDTFMHDSEHSFDCMWFEFNAAWPCLKPGGVLLSDDVNSTEAFARFAAQEGRHPVRLARGMAMLAK
ncbi:MAG TPA: class I SAM-dependent methyltransferase [Gaiellaceae bacterium]